MRNTKLLAVLLSVLLVCVGCDKFQEHPETGTLRHKLFTECMELSAKITRSGDDDVSDIIDSCGSQAYYMANHIMQTN